MNQIASTLLDNCEQWPVETSTISRIPAKPTASAGQIIKKIAVQTKQNKSRQSPNI